MFSYRPGLAAVSLAVLTLGTGSGPASDLSVVRKDAPPSWAAGAAIPENQFERLHKFICPQSGESKWAQLPWMWNLAEARKKAVEADKPLLFWRAGGGDPLGRA